MDPLSKRLRHLNEIIIVLGKTSLLDELLRQAVELGRTKLGFDRLALFLVTDDPSFYVPTFSTDEFGNTLDERMAEPLGWADDAALRQAIERQHSSYVREEVSLRNSKGDIVGLGWQIITLLWDGDHCIGWMVADNLINQRPLTPHDVEILELYGVSVGNLCNCKRMQATLVQERNLLRTLVDSTMDYICVKDTQSRYILVNRPYYLKTRQPQMTAEQDMLGKTDFEFYPATLASHYLAQDQQVLQQGTLIQNQTEVETTASGEVVHLLTTKAPLRDDQGHIIGLVKVSRDITDYAREETAHIEGEMRAARLLDSMVEAVITLDQRQQIIAFSSGAERMFGYSAAEAIGQPLSLLVPQRFVANHHRYVHHFARGPDQARHMLERHKALLAIRKDGTEFPIEASIAKLTWSGHPVLLAVVQDITLRKQAEQERLKLEQLQLKFEQERELLTLREAFVSAASHEFRTPLAVIGVSVGLLEHHYDRMTPEKRLDHFRKINHQIQHMVQILDAILVISKANAGMLKCNPTPIKLPHFCRSLFQTFVQLDNTAHKMGFRINDALEDVVMDENLLRHMLENLLSNALKYTPTDQKVELTVFQDGQEVVFQIQDEGIGIPLEDQQRLFETFYRAKNVGYISGTGLGLAIVKAAVTIHGGTIQFKSQEGHGTIFTIRLPKTPQES